MKYNEIGRSLHLEWGDGDDKIKILLHPMPSKVGFDATNTWLKVMFPPLAVSAGVTTLESLDAEVQELVKRLFGDELDKFEQLRVPEQAEALAAAVMWNGYEGGEDLVKIVAEQGFAAARQEYATRLGFGEAFDVALNQALGRAAAERVEQAAGETPEAA